MNRSFEIRLYPTKLQEQKLNQTFGACRFMYNCTLFQKQKAYSEQIKITTDEIVKHIKSENPWLKEIGSQAICQTLNDLNSAYKNWFNSLSHKTKQKSNAPKFKKKHDKQSYRDCMMKDKIELLCNQDTRKISIPKIGKITYRAGYDFSKYNITKVCNITIKKSKTNKYYCSICCECQEPKKLKQNDYSIGFDLGLKDFLIDSDGIVIDNPKYFRKSQDKLAKEQRKLSNCTKGSNNYIKQKLKVALVHEKIRNQRKDFQHKISRQLINENQVIVSEDLKPSNMVKNRKLAKSIADASFSSFCNMIDYKAKWYGRTYIKVGSFYPSSKMCHCCGYKNTTLTLADREWECLNCHTLLDRDKNAALNILDEGLKILNKSAQGLSVEPIDTVHNNALE
jgi:transposase, IS605 OrfB family, central region